MLYFVSHETENFPACEKLWRVGDKKPLLTEVVEVQADGDELDYIRKKFYNLPMSYGRLLVWKGALAQFIYDNFY